MYKTEAPFSLKVSHTSPTLRKWLDVAFWGEWRKKFNYNVHNMRTSLPETILNFRPLNLNMSPFLGTSRMPCTTRQTSKLLSSVEQRPHYDLVGKLAVTWPPFSRCQYSDSCLNSCINLCTWKQEVHNMLFFVVMRNTYWKSTLAQAYHV